MPFQLHAKLRKDILGLIDHQKALVAQQGAIFTPVLDLSAVRSRPQAADGTA